MKTADGLTLPGQMKYHDVYTTTVAVVSKERQGIVLDIATVLNSLNAKVRSLNARDTGDGKSLAIVTLESHFSRGIEKYNQQAFGSFRRDRGYTRN